MDWAEQLEILQAAQGDPALLALAMVDFAHHGLTAAERARIKAALLAAAVPHWCNSGFLAALLETTQEDGEHLLAHLESLTVVELFPTRGENAISVQRQARTALRRYLADTDPGQFRVLVDRACGYVSARDGEDARVEAIFHRFSIDRGAASAECLALYAELEESGTSDSRRVLLMNLIELIDLAPLEPAPQRGAPTKQHKSPVVLPALSVAARQATSAPNVFDVFLCHNSQDKPEVEVIGLELKKRKLRPWLDKWELPPGRPWQQLLEEQIETIGAAAVFVGRSGFGPWQNAEHRAFLSEFQRRSCPVIPVILNSVTTPPRLPPFLAGMTWVDFRDADSLPYSMLIWGVTGTRPPELP